MSVYFHWHHLLNADNVIFMILHIDRPAEAGKAAGERTGPEAGVFQQAVHQLQQLSGRS